MAAINSKLAPVIKSLVRQVVDRLPVSATEVDVEKALADALNRRAGEYPAFVRAVMREGHRVHLANVLQYRRVMLGRN